MPNCPKCGKPVYFAERITSIGFDWHPLCLRCEECGKRLNPGGHSEHKGKPYCNTPCYSGLFGPKGYGRSGVVIHATAADGEGFDIASKDLMLKIRQYNAFLSGMLGELSSRELNGRIVFEGVMRIYWGLKKPIRLASSAKSKLRLRSSFAESDSPVSPYTKKLVTQLQRQRTMNENDHRLRSSSSTESESNSPATPKRQRSVRARKISNAASLRPPGKQNDEAFIPPYGTYANLRIISTYSTEDVMKMLLEKFTVENSLNEYALYVIHDHGGAEPVKNDDYPLQVRLKLGPSEAVAKIFIMDAADEARVDVSPEVAQYINLAMPVLEGILSKYDEEEKREAAKIRKRYQLMKRQLNDQVRGIQQEA
ncbi:ras association domain-containing protein 2-like [Corticium candelabrum]|uniref:ras association domain-containing protein 2-like n=1 Tax=Corticium candelabrum TaxID=121492 RepID=UPI002E26CD9E|nr:ras association domain-containing protein 2-like [Corticium candelabrum]